LLQQSEQTTTLLAHACVTWRMGEFMLGNSLESIAITTAFRQRIYPPGGA